MEGRDPHWLRGRREKGQGRAQEERHRRTEGQGLCLKGAHLHLCAWGDLSGTQADRSPAGKPLEAARPRKDPVCKRYLSRMARQCWPALPHGTGCLHPRATSLHWLEEARPRDPASRTPQPWGHQSPSTSTRLWPLITAPLPAGRSHGELRTPTRARSRVQGPVRLPLPSPGSGSGPRGTESPRAGRPLGSCCNPGHMMLGTVVHGRGCSLRGQGR